MLQATAAVSAQPVQPVMWREFEANNDPDLLQRVLASSHVQTRAENGLRIEQPYPHVEGPIRTIILTADECAVGAYPTPSRIFNLRKVESWGDDYALGPLTLPEMLSVREQYIDQPIGEQIYIATDHSRFGNVFSLGRDSGGGTWIHLNPFRSGDAFKSKDKILHRLINRPGAALKPESLSSDHAQPVQFLQDDGHIRRLEDIDADIIRFAFFHYDGRKAEAARRLGMGKSTFYRRLAELGIA